MLTRAVPVRCKYLLSSINLNGVKLGNHGVVCVYVCVVRTWIKQLRVLRRSPWFPRHRDGFLGNPARNHIVVSIFIAVREALLLLHHVLG
jgi:hypothetical protein